MRSAARTRFGNLRADIGRAMFGAKRECEAYQVSVACVERRLKKAPECQTKHNKEYGTRKLASEKCFENKNCAGAGAK